MSLSEESSQEKCVRYLHSVNTTKADMDGKLATSTPKSSQNLDLASTFFMKLFSSSKQDQSKNDTGVTCNGDESSFDDGLLTSLVCTAKLFPDESSTESEYDGGLELLIDECTLYQDWDGIEKKYRNYLKKNKGMVSLVDSLRSVRLVTQAKLRQKLTKIVLKHFKQDKFKLKRKPLAESKRSLTERNVETEQIEENTCTEQQDKYFDYTDKIKMNGESHNVSKQSSTKGNVRPEKIEGDYRTEERNHHKHNEISDLVESSTGEGNKRKRRSLNMTNDFTIDENQSNNRSTRTSERIHSMPPGYFKTKPAALFYVLPEVSKKRKSSSSQHGSNRKKKKTHNETKPKDVYYVYPSSDSEEEAVEQHKKRLSSSKEPKPEPVDSDDEEVSVVEPKKGILSSPEPQPELVDSDDEEVSVVQPMKDHKINTKKNKLPAKIPPHKEGKSGSLLTSKNHSDDEKTLLVVEGKGHVKKRVSKNISVKSRQSLPDLSPLNKPSGAEDNKRKSTRLSSHPSDFFKTKPKDVYYIYPSSASEEEAVDQHKKRLSSSKEPQPEPVDSDDEKVSVVQPKKGILSSPDHKINTKKNKLPAKIPPHKEGKSGSLLTSKNHSDDEKTPLVVEGKGHVKKRVSKNISVKSRQSLPDLSPLNKPSGAKDNKRKSTRLSSHPSDFFKTKPKDVYYICPSSASEEEAVDQHKKELSSSKEPQPESVDSDDEEVSVVEPKKGNLSSPDHKINTKKNKLPAKIPPHKEGKSGSLLTSKNHSDDEKTPLVVEGRGHVKKRVSKNISVKSRRSLSDLSLLNKPSGAEDNKRKSLRLSSHPSDFFKTKPIAVYYIMPSDDGKEETVKQHKKRLSSSKATRKLYSGDSF